MARPLVELLKAGFVFRNGKETALATTSVGSLRVLANNLGVVQAGSGSERILNRVRATQVIRPPSGSPVEGGAWGEGGDARSRVWYQGRGPS
eukprot:COSAG01_NODE_362_length_18130_cov_34.672307_11_plen_92_part_00